MEPAQAAPVTAPTKNQPYVLFILLALFIPIVGFILGIVYIAKNNDKDRNLGIATLVTSIISFILATIIVQSITAPKPISTETVQSTTPDTSQIQ